MLKSFREWTIRNPDFETYGLSVVKTDWDTIAVKTKKGTRIVFYADKSFNFEGFTVYVRELPTIKDLNIKRINAWFGILRFEPPYDYLLKHPEIQDPQNGFKKISQKEAEEITNTGWRNRDTSLNIIRDYATLELAKVHWKRFHDVK